jgi:hypothetical protein
LYYDNDMIMRLDLDLDTMLELPLLEARNKSVHLSMNEFAGDVPLSDAERMVESKDWYDAPKYWKAQEWGVVTAGAMLVRTDPRGWQFLRALWELPLRYPEELGHLTHTFPREQQGLNWLVIRDDLRPVIQVHNTTVWSLYVSSALRHYYGEYKKTPEAVEDARNAIMGLLYSWLERKFRNPFV